MLPGALNIDYLVCNFLIKSVRQSYEVPISIKHPVVTTFLDYYNNMGLWGGGGKGTISLGKLLY